MQAIQSVHGGSSMTAVAERDAIVSQPTREKVYSARREDLDLIKTARYPILNATTGAKSGQETPGITVGFRGGMLRLPLEGKIRTKHGIEVDAPEIIEWLERHPLFGDAFEGFIPVNVSAPPVSDEEQQQLVNASLDFDDETLELMLEQERAGWAREGLVVILEGAIVRIRETRAKVEAEATVRAEAEAAARAAADQPKPAAKPKAAK